MYTKRKLQMGVAAVIAVAACTDGVNAPVGPAAPAIPTAQIAGGMPASGERVIVTRTIDVIPLDQLGKGQLATHVKRKQTYTFGVGTVGVGHGDDATKRALAPKTRRQPTTIDDVPVVGLTFPARASSLRAAIVPWHRSVEIVGDPGLIAESDGTGDAPASTIRYVRNGVTERTVTQEWELWQRQWQLIRRETKSTDGSAYELVEVKRTGRAGIALQSATAWAREDIRLGTGSPSFDIYDDAEDCQPCKALEDAVTDAYQMLLAAIVPSLVACAPAPTMPLTCLTALTAVWAAEVRFDRAVANRDACRENPPKCPPKTSTTVDCSKRAAGAHRIAPSFDCAVPTDGGGAGGGTGGTSTGGSAVCTYYYEYDLYTGEILYSELLYCVWISDT